MRPHPLRRAADGHGLGPDAAQRVDVGVANVDKSPGRLECGHGGLVPVGELAAAALPRATGRVEQVPEAAGLENDADDVGLVGLVGVDQLLREDVLGMGLERLQLGQPGAGSDQFAAQYEELSALGVQLRLDASDPAVEGRDACV